MSRLFLLLASCIAFAPTNTNAQTINQSNPINVEAVVRIGGPPVAINQTGVANYAGVVQAGRNPSTTINQNGKLINSVAISQTGRNTTASVNQVGARIVNSSVIVQRAGFLHHR
jgi:hypothetical protein